MRYQVRLTGSTTKGYYSNAYPRKSQVKFGIDGRLAHLFDPETEKNLI